MKKLKRNIKRCGLVILFLPIALMIIWALYEIFGMCVNHMATGKQTDALKRNLESEISDIEFIDIYSETGNTSGTGNHVECLSVVVFTTKMQELEIVDCMSEYYMFDEWSCYVKKTEDGYYTFYLNMPAPFEDNIEGH